MSKKYPLKKVGNIAIDTICASIFHYRQFHKKIKYINLSSFFWIHFTEWMKEHAPEVKVDSDGAMFHNTIIRKGHRFMVENIEFEFYPQEIIKA